MLLWPRGLCNHPEVIVGKAETTDATVHSASWWRWAFVGVVMFSLVVTLATRTFHDPAPRAATVHSGSVQVMRQHMDRDAVRWAAAVANITVAQAPTFYPRVAPAGPPLPTLLLEENLYNRPPPAC
jgi:hypothetical protein